MANTPWNNQGTQTAPMNRVNQVLGYGLSMSQYYHTGQGNKVNWNFPTSSTQGSRGLRGVCSMAVMQINQQYGGSFGSNNNSTTIFFNQPAQTYQTVYLQNSFNNRLWLRNGATSTGYGGTGGRNLQGNNQNPPAYAGTAAFVVQGDVNTDFRFNSQGYNVYGGGGGGGAGNQGNRANQQQLIQYQSSPSGGGSGGGGGGYGPGGNTPDARYQGGAGQNGFTYGGGAGGGNGGGGRGANDGAAGGNSGNYGGNSGGPGAPPGGQIGGSYGYSQITY